jgi:hypothetical protein
LNRRGRAGFLVAVEGFVAEAGAFLDVGDAYLDEVDAYPERGDAYLDEVDVEGLRRFDRSKKS